MLPFVFLAVNVAQWSSNELDLGLQYLPVTERNRILRFRLKADQHRSLASQLLKRYLFSKHMDIAWEDITFKESEYGKPSTTLDVGENVDFNVSHHGEWVVIGLCSNGTIGVDVTRYETPHESVDAFVDCFADQLAEDELVKLHSTKNESQKLQLFYEIWCLKESYIKALGVGLHKDLKFVNFLSSKNAGKEGQNVVVQDLKEPENEKTFVFNLSYIDQEHPVAICTNAKVQGSEKILSSSSLKVGQTKQDIEKNGSQFDIVTFSDMVQFVGKQK
ncbi:4'-phosphopantetheinyl transferase superfamily [Umbelopsis sp. AD052]|nr:4'-phosphopantetheinyl transferase superfamily [Umbelopsis sp. AD052]